MWKSETANPNHQLNNAQTKTTKLPPLTETVDNPATAPTMISVHLENTGSMIYTS